MSAAGSTEAGPTGPTFNLSQLFKMDSLLPSQTCLHRVIDDWLEHINNGELTGTCLLHISKCFDSINHIILLKKLEMYGIIGTELDWISSYLNGRKQFVNFNNETSESCEITCGVPQGPVLGPILFSLFINDISNFAVEGCVLNMYDDDVIIYTSAMSTHGLKCKLQSCIDSISNWYDMNKLCYSHWKQISVMVIAISINVDKLQLVEQAKYLGLWIRNDPSWDDHILELCRKMYFMFTCFVVSEKSSHPNYCLTFTSLMCSIRSIYKEFKICQQESCVITLII